MGEKVSLVLPVHNEADNIESVIRSFYKEIGSKIPLQIIVAEDGSTDGTKEILTKLSQEIPMTLLTEKARLGYMGGLKRGLEEAVGEYVLFCDSDGQHFPSDFWKMYNAKEGYDMVDGWRIGRADTAFRRVMSQTFQQITRVLFGLKNLRDITSPYRLVRTDVAKKAASQAKYMRESFWTEFTIRAMKGGARVKEVAVKHRPRFNGKTVVYKPSKIPEIVYNQLRGMLRVLSELRRNPAASPPSQMGARRTL